MYTRQEFEELRTTEAAKLAADTGLRRDALDLLVRADKHYWIHQANWMGEPCLQLPQDLFALQEIICQTRPEFIIEVGVAWAGSMLFYATLLESLGEGRVIGIDIYIPDDLRTRVMSHGRVSERISLIHGSSVEAATIEQVAKALGGSRKTLVHLDSNHTHEHVRKELSLFAPLVGPGHYLICGDTIVEDMPESDRPRPWGKGNNPRTALEDFLEAPEGAPFEKDRRFQSKYLFTCNPEGYLRRKT
jgi:cephalosporin hydroxylase